MWRRARAKNAHLKEKTKLMMMILCLPSSKEVLKKHVFIYLKKINLRLSLSPVSLHHPPTSHSSTCSTAPPTPCPPILLVSLDMLPSPLPTHFSAPLHFGHSYIYGVIRCSSPSGASRITAHTELWRAGKGKGGGVRRVLGVCVVGGEVERGEDGGIFKWGGLKDEWSGRRSASQKMKEKW